MIKESQISSKLAEVPIEELASQNGFSLRADNQLDAQSFIMGFFLMIMNEDNTLRQWAIEVGKLLQRLFSPQALNKKLQFRQQAFVKALLQHLLHTGTCQSPTQGMHSKLLDSFGRVFVEDSMCVKLPLGLAEFFPGAHSKTGQAATARIQLRLDLKTHTHSHIEVQSYRDNDQKFSSHILHTLQADDLVLRDMGYWALWVFRLINWMDAFFLSRYRPSTHVYDIESGEQLDLLKLLKKARAKGQTVVDMDVLIGKKEQLPLRLVAVEAPQKVVQQRRRKALKNRSKKANHSNEYLELLGWTIFITNVPCDIWMPKQMLQVYGFRWRIEIVFKCWKSGFNFEHLFKKKQSLSPPRAAITLYLLLIWLTLFFVRWFNFFLSAVYAETKRFVSILKFPKFVKDHFEQLLQCSDLNEFVEFVAYHYVYDKRKNILNSCQSLYLLN